MNITKIGNKWYAVLIVPKDVKAALGRSKFIKALDTSDERIAKLRAPVYVEGWKDQIRELRGQAPYNHIEEAIRTAARPLDSWHQVERFTQIHREQGLDAAKEYGAIASGAAVALSAYVEDFKAELAKIVSANTLRLRISDLTLFIDKFRFLAAVNQPALNAWIAELREEGKTDKTIKRVLQPVKTFLEYLKEAGVYNGVLSYTLPRFGAVKAKATNREKFEDSEIKLLLDQSKGKERINDLILFGMYSGLRVNEICMLRKTDLVSVDGVSCFDVKGTKTDAAARLVPIHSKLADRVKELADSTEEFLFKGLRINKQGNRSVAALKSFSDFKLENGFGANKVFHSFRHGFNVKLLQAGIPEIVVAQLLGHEHKHLSEGTRTYYRGGAGVAVLKDAVERVSYKLD